MTNLEKIFKRRDITSLKMFSMIKAMIFPVIVYGCDNWIIIVSDEELMLLNCGVDKTLENPLEYKEFQPVIAQGKQSQIFIGRTDAEVEAPILKPTPIT